MKRYFLYIFACVCALTYATTAQAQTFETGDIITISDGNGNYLAVNNGDVVSTDDLTEACFWVVTNNNNTYRFRSYADNQERYLRIRSSNRITLSTTSYYFTYSNNRLSLSGYYLYHNGSSWQTKSNTSNIGSVFLLLVQGRFTNVTPTSGTTVKSLNSITVTGDVAMTSVTGANIQLTGNGQTLTGANGLEVKISEEDLTKLVITVAGSLTAGEYTLTIPKGAVKYNGGDYLSATYNWTLEGPKYVAVAPTSGYIVKSLEKITVTGDMEMTALDLSKIQLVGEGVTLNADNGLGVAISTTNTKQLVITLSTTLVPGDYILTLNAGAVKSGDMPFGEVEYNWTVDPEKSVALMHVYGFYDALDNRGYQKVHTVERTIYYTGKEESIELRLAERNFFGYMRWYDYTTDRNITTSWVDVPTGRNNVEFDELTDGTVHFGWYGLHTTHLQDNNNSNNVPSIRPWNDNKPHTVACDVSSYINYETTTQGENIARIVEPTLSYRQIFYFKPASEIADRIANLGANQFLEVYTYQAPHTQNVLLTTEYRYSTENGTHESELGYFVRNTDGDLLRVGTDIEATWYLNGNAVNNPTYPTKDFFQVAAAAAGTKRTYELIVKANTSLGVTNDIRLAQFNVEFVNATTHGPSTDGINLTVGEKTYSVATQTAIENNFQVLAYNDFNFDKFNPTGNQVKVPFDWEQSTYGFYNPDMAYNSRDNNGHEIPYYGEYMFVKQAHGQGDNGASWISGGGSAKEGYALFVDGTTEPGLVASIVAENVVVCAQKLMYCSMWLKNPRTGTISNTTALPNFRCNIQGRNKNANNTYSEWKNIGMFYIGELAHNSAQWCQVVFPITSSEAYNEVRVQLYNFGTGGDGNDFMLDDLTLFTDKSEMGSYQMEPTIVSGSNSTSPYTMAVLRVDYKSHSDKDVLYYQIYNLTEENVKEPLGLKDYLNTEEGLAYSGSVEVPEGGTLPPDASAMTMIEFSEFLENNNSTTGRYFVDISAEGEEEEIVMYLVHKIPKPIAPKGSPYPYESTNYWIRMSYEEVADDKWDDLQTDCTMEMLFTATQSTTFELRNAMTDALLEEFMYQSDNNCANTLYALDVKITQDTDPENVGGNESGLAYADWLKGFASDGVYAEHAVSPNATADAAFEEHYGYTRDEVTAAINDLRSKNKTVADVAALTAADFSNAKNKAIVEKLCNDGYLELRAQSVNFYLGTADTARYWVFPIEGTAVSTQGKPLHDTPEPMWVQVSTYDSEFELQVFGYTLPENHATALPIVRTLASKMNDQIVITYNTKTWNAAASQEGDAYLFSTTDEALNAQLSRGIVQYNCVVDNANNTITLTVPTDNEVEFKIGEEYIVGVTLRDEEGHATPGTGNNGCPVGTWFFDILLVPDVVTWTGENGADWNADANWSYVEGEKTFHYVPIAGSKVIVKNGTYPTLSTLETNPIPLHVNYPLSPVCGEIYFEAGATMENQHLLKHDRAFVDLVVPQGTWNSVAVPIAGVVSGDMFIPHKTTGEYQGESTESTDPFGVTGFNPEGSRLSTSAYAFWQSFFNKTVYMLNENGSKESAISTTTAAFAPTNSLEEALEAGAGHQLLGFGPDPDEANLTIRLPKPDTEYSYYYPNGAAATPTQINRGENEGKLAFAPISIGNDEKGMVITLTNEQASTDANGNLFMFGNPSMAYINMNDFLDDNEGVDGAYYQMTNDSWEASTTWASANGGYLAPMRSVMLKATGSENTLTVVLKPEHLAVNPTPQANALASRRAASKAETQMMVIRADVEGTQAQCIVAANTTANDIYTMSEDALFFSSGVEAEVSDVAATSPVNMYTLSERVPMMVDVRKNIDTIPLAMLVMESYQTEMMTLTFDLSADWDKDVYFCDSKTGAKTLIFDGMEIEVELSANHETRYFLEGPDKFEPGNDIWSSTENVKGEINVWAYSPDNGQLVVTSNDILKSVEVYDLSGRLVADMELELQYNSTSLSIPTGAYIIKAALRDNSVHTLSSLVK